jgi:hypothetical protein
MGERIFLLVKVGEGDEDERWAPMCYQAGQVLGRGRRCRVNQDFVHHCKENTREGPGIRSGAYSLVVQNFLFVFLVSALIIDIK